MGGGEGEGVGSLEMAFTFQAGSSLHDALGVGQAVVVPHVEPCHVPRGNQSQQLDKPVSREKRARSRAGWKGSVCEGAVAAARVSVPHSDFWSKAVS